MVSLGGAFHLLPAARLWFKALPASGRKIQGICQSQASIPIEINVHSTVMPWIQVGSSLHCDAWSDNKMHCKDINDQPQLDCVVLDETNQPPVDFHERTTSVRLRSMPVGTLSPDIHSVSSNQTIQQQILSEMQNDLDLCRTLHQTEIAVMIAWKVDHDGQVKTTIPSIDGTLSIGLSDRPLIDCLTAVIKDFSYPQLTKDIWISGQF